MLRAECAKAAERYGLSLPRGALSGRIGEHLGRGTGASLEFVDYRDYSAGDDLRHVDWRAYARTDQLRVRLFREEVSLSVDVIVDCSASMAVSECKERAVRDLVAATELWAGNLGGTWRGFVAGGGRIEARSDLAFPAGSSVDSVVPRAPLRARSLRILVSDFLFPVDVGPAIRRLAHGASHLYVLQLLDPVELEPTPSGAVTLIDCESNDELEITLDARAVRCYRERLVRLRAAVERAVHQVGGSFAQVRGDEPEAMFRRDLLPAGVLEPRAK